MSGWLLDTNVVSEFAPGRLAMNSRLLGWFSRHDASLFLSAVTALEIETGVRNLYRRGAGRRADEMAEWIGEVLARFGDRVLPMDVAVAREAGSLSEVALTEGRHPGFEDVVIAATARVHGLELLSRNVRHFVDLGVTVRDPFAVNA